MKKIIQMFTRGKQFLRLCTLSCLMTVPMLWANAQTADFTCGDTFFDDGGQNGNYSELANGSITTTDIIVCPTNPGLEVAEVTFTKFDVADKDTLFAYDGLANDAPLFTATTSGSGSGPSVADSPGGGTIRATCENGGCIRLVFKQTNDSERAGGWKANVTCNRVSTSNIDASNLETQFVLADCATGLAPVPLVAPTYTVCGNPVSLVPTTECPLPATSELPSSIPANGSQNGTALFPAGVHDLTYVAPDREFPVRVRVAVPQINCNDLIRVSLESNCYATLTPDLILEDFCPPNDILKYEISLVNEDAAPLVGVSDNGYPTYDFSNVHCNTVLDVRVRRIYDYGFDIDCDGEDDRIVDECFSQIRVEDQIAPLFVDAPDVTTIYCYDNENLLQKLNERIEGERVVGIEGGFIIGEVSGNRIEIPGLTNIEGTDQYEEILENCLYDVEVTDWREIPADCTIDNLGPYQCWNLDQLHLVSSTSSVLTFFERTYKVTDKCGNKDTQVQLIALAQPDIVAPVPEFEVDCGVDVEPTSLYAAWVDWVDEGRPAGDPRQFFSSYIPNFDETPLALQEALAQYGVWLPTNSEAIITDSSGDEVPASLDHSHCGYAISWEDNDTVQVCGNGFKIFRDWTVYNWCDGHLELIDVIPQVIKVGDTSAPIFTSTPTYRFVETGEYQCWTGIVFNRPEVIDDCGSDVDITVQLGDEIKTFTGNTVRFDHLEIGETVQAIFTALDECGNTQVKVVDIFIDDQIPPVAICEEFRVVSLGVDCNVTVPAESFDDGSFDNCGGVTFMVARMDEDDDLDGLPETEDFQLSVRFTPADIAAGTDNSTMIVFKVTDTNGNVNYCMTEVQLQDKLPPVCPPRSPQIVDCQAELVDDLIAAQQAAEAPVELSELLTDGLLNGVPQIIDNCAGVGNNEEGLTDPLAVQVISANFSGFDADRRSGIITYTYQAQDAAGNRSAPCPDTIVVRKFSDWTMTFPNDIEFFCEATGTSVPQPVPLDAILENNGCDLWGLNVEPERFDVVEEACYKLVYNYRLINWCTWNPSNTEEAIVERPANMLLDAEEQVRLAYSDLDFDGVNDIDDFLDGDLYETSDRIDDGDFVLIDAFDEAYQNIPSYTLLSNFTGQQEQYVSAQKYGLITYRQVIKVTDFTPPGLRVRPMETFCGGDTNPGDDPCTANVNIEFKVEDICSPLDAITVECSLKLFGEGAAIADPFGQLDQLNSDRYQVSGNYPLNPNSPDSTQHVLVVVVQDGCGNQTTREIAFTMKDCKAPTAYCYAGLSVDLMPSGEVELNATDFDAGSFDFCTPNELLKYTFADPRIHPDSTTRIFRCDEGEIGTVPVRLWVQDLAGNTSFCETFVIIQNNQEGTECPGNGAAFVAGAIETEMEESVENVTVNLSGSTTGTMKTSGDGGYSFPNLEFSYDYTITPHRDDNPANGVSTLDLVLLSKHILGIKELDTPYKMIAADINNSGSITTFDLVLLRKLILQIDDHFMHTTSWRFIDRSYEFPNPNDPWQEEFPEVININDLPQERRDADFIAVKMGDLNNSAVPNSLLGSGGRSTYGEWLMQVEDRTLDAGETYTIPFTAQSLRQIEGFQYTLQFDANALEVVDIEAGILDENNVGWRFIDEGMLTISWNTDGTAYAENEELFRLKVRSKQAVTLSEALQISSKYTTAEAYDQDGDLMDILLDFGGGKLAGPTFELYQNTPNPFSDKTLISFNLPTATTATLSIMDISGKMIRKIRRPFDKGYNEVQLDLSDLPETGMLYYRLYTSEYAATQRMIRLRR